MQICRVAILAPGNTDGSLFLDQSFVISENEPVLQSQHQYLFKFPASNLNDTTGKLVESKAVFNFGYLLVIFQISILVIPISRGAASNRAVYLFKLKNNITLAKSQNSFIKKQLEQKKLKKRKEKEERKLERKENSAGGSLEAMLVYVDEFGNFSSTPPEPKKEEKKTGKQV